MPAEESMIFEWLRTFVCACIGIASGLYAEVMTCL